MKCVNAYIFALMIFLYDTGSWRSECARILAYFQVPSHSHQIVFQPLWRELSLRGHQVTVVTPNPLNEPELCNLTEIDVSASYVLMDLQHRLQSISLFDAYRRSYELFFRIYDSQMQQIQMLQQQNWSQFDVVLVEGFNPTVYGFASQSPQAAVVALASLDLFSNSYNVLGNYLHPILNPNVMFWHIYELMSIWDRVESVIFEMWFYVWYKFSVTPQADVLVKKHFGPDTEYVGDIEKRISLILVNRNPVLHPIRLDVPLVKSMGFLHIQTKKQHLDFDLQSILDSATNGVIYVSLGSNIKSANLHAGMRNKFIAVFRKLPYTILWKWESENIRDQPQNVHTRKWLPQQDVLRHPNIRAFVTQGGLQSLEEAIYYTVPVVGLPFIADQPMNVQKIDYLGAGIHINPHNFEVDQLFEAIMAVAEDDKYRNKMKELRDVCLDQPETGLERAIWWIEYVIRHKGARYLRSPLADMPLYQYLMLDVLAVFVSTILLISLIGLWLIRTCCRYFAQSKLMRDSNRSSDTLKPVINKKYTMHTKEETNFKNITAEDKNSRRKFD